jgi:hypothetical protein
MLSRSIEEVNRSYRAGGQFTMRASHDLSRGSQVYARQDERPRSYPAVLLLGRGAGRAAEALEEIAPKIFRFLLGRLFCGHGGLAGQNQLRDVGQGDSVAPGDALARELPDEIAEEEIHLIGGRKAVNVAEKLCGEDLRVHDGNSLEALCVVGAERGPAGSVCGTTCSSISMWQRRPFGLICRQYRSTVVLVLVEVLDLEDMVGPFGIGGKEIRR